MRIWEKGHENKNQILKTVIAVVNKPLWLYVYAKCHLKVKIKLNPETKKSGTIARSTIDSTE